MVTVKQCSHQTALQGFVDAMPYYGNAIKLHTWSDSFRYLKQRKGGRVRPLGGFTWLPINKKA